MKTQKFPNKFLMLTLTVFMALPSCIDSPDPIPVSIVDRMLYVIQEPVVQGDETQMQYLPYIGYYYYTSEDLDRAEILKDGITMNPRTYKNLSICQITPSDHQTGTLSELNGIYTLNPIGVSGSDWERSYELDYADEQKIGPVELTEFGYKDGNFYATFKKTENAEYIGFYIQPYISESLAYYACPFPQAMNDERFQTATVTSVQEQMVTVAFNPYYYQAYTGVEKYRITPIARNLSATGWSLIRKAEVWGELTGEQHNDDIVFYPFEAE